MILSISAVAFQCNNFPPGTILQISCRKETKGQNDLMKEFHGFSALVRLAFSLRPSAYLCVLCVLRPFNAEDAEIRRGPQRKTA
jgi:hypothetical protein